MIRYPQRVVVVGRDLIVVEKANALNEVRILASVRHPNIISYKEAFYDQAS